MSLQGAHLYMYIILCGTSAEGGVKDTVQFMNRPLCTAVFCPFKLTNALLHAQYTVHVVCEVFICLHITDASVVIAPSHDYTTFENNVPNFTFSCSGNGAFILWTVDGQSTGSSYVLNKGIQYTPFIISPDGLTVSLFQPLKLTATLQ